MSFENTRNNLAQLEKNGTPISAEKLFSLLVRLMDDAYEFNNISGVSELVTGNQEKLIKAVRLVLKDTVRITEENRDGFQALSTSGRRNLEGLLAEAAETGSSLEETNVTLCKIEKEHASLVEKRRELEENRRRISQVGMDCALLKDAVDKLSDESLPKMEAERTALQNTLEGLQAKGHALQNEVETMQEQIHAAKRLVQTEEQEKATLDKSLDSLSRHLKDLQDGKKYVSQQAVIVRKELDKIKERDKDLAEKTARYAALYTAMNSVLNEAKTSRWFFTSNEAAVFDDTMAALLPFNAENRITSGADLSEWLDSTQQKIEFLLSLYQQGLQALLNEGAQMFDTESGG